MKPFDLDVVVRACCRARRRALRRVHREARQLWCRDLPPRQSQSHPEQTVLYRVIQQHLESFLEHAHESSGKRLPKYVENNSDATSSAVCTRMDSPAPSAPTQFMTRIAALVPPPRHPLARFYGVWAPHHRWRNRLVAATLKTKRSTCSDPSGAFAAAGTDGVSAIAEGETEPAPAPDALRRSDRGPVTRRVVRDDAEGSRATGKRSSCARNRRDGRWRCGQTPHKSPAKSPLAWRLLSKVP
jgi:hypothetical protein